MHRFAGVTLIELMVVLGVISIMAVLAFPSFSQQISQDRIVSTANQLNSVYKFARSEAVKRDKPVSLIVSDNRWLVTLHEGGIDTILKEFKVSKNGVNVALVALAINASGEVDRQAEILVKAEQTNITDYILCVLKSGQSWLVKSSPRGCE